MIAIGIEILKEAVDCADELKKLNGLGDKMQNICAPCENALPEIMANENLAGNNTVLVLDPPRQGVDETLIQTIKRRLFITARL